LIKYKNRDKGVFYVEDELFLVLVKFSNPKTNTSGFGLNTKKNRFELLIFYFVNSE
jgi:hypothetical protein